MKKTGKLTSIKKLKYTALGSPRFLIVVGGEAYKTTASVAYEINNLMVGKNVVIELQKNKVVDIDIKRTATKAKTKKHKKITARKRRNGWGCVV